MVFMTVRPTERGEEIFAHCESCGYNEPLGLILGGDDALAEEALTLWEDTHRCGDPDPTGLFLYGTEEQAKEAYGLYL